MREKERERESIIGFSKRLFCRQMKPTLPLRFRVLADQWTGNRDNNKIEKEPCSLPNFDRDCFTSLLCRIWIKFRSEKAHFHGTAQRHNVSLDLSYSNKKKIYIIFLALIDRKCINYHMQRCGVAVAMILDAYLGDCFNDASHTRHRYPPRISRRVGAYKGRCQPSSFLLPFVACFAIVPRDIPGPPFSRAWKMHSFIWNRSRVASPRN